jgi:hypothetical protein
MSTVYRIVGRGHRLTLKRAQAIAKGLGGRISGRKANRRQLELPEGFIQLYRTGKTAWNEFERYGMNTFAALAWADALEGQGMTVLSEHDEGFYR